MRRSSSSFHTRSVDESAGNESDPEGGHDEAKPKSRKDPQKSLPDVPPNGISQHAPCDEVPADAEEPVHSQLTKTALIDTILHVNIAQSDGMRNDDNERQNEPQEIDAVVARMNGKCVAAPSSCLPRLDQQLFHHKNKA